MTEFNCQTVHKNKINQVLITKINEITIIKFYLAAKNVMLYLWM